MKLIDFLM